MVKEQTGYFDGLTQRGTAVKKLFMHWNSLIGLLLLVPIVLGGIFAPAIAPYDPTETHPTNALEGPSSEFLLGTDHLGRDLFSRILYGARTSLLLGVLATALGVALGVPIGLISGYAGGQIDEILMRAMDVLLTFPSLLLALLIVSMLSSNIINAILAIGIVYTPRLARVTRSSTLSIKNEQFVTAARVRGESHLYIAFGEILPNAMYPIIVESSIRIGFAIMIGTSLSFLGLGTQPPFPDWGYMISTSRNYLGASPWFLVWPSVALGSTILGFNLFGDGLREVLDPQVTNEEL